MVNPIQNAAQQAYLSPFQKDNNQVQNQRDREQETQKSQGKPPGNSVESSAVQSREGSQKNAVIGTSKSASAGQEENRRERGSLVDITV